MKLQFSSHDSVYSILSTLKKSPSYKRTFLHISDDHALFDHSRWGNQIRITIDEHHLDLVCIAPSRKQIQYWEQCHIPYISEYRNTFERLGDRVINLFSSTKTIHQKLFHEKSILYVPLVIFECCMIGL
jgi:hypothetical protein